ncbi:MAG: S8 family peptidase [Armatimonadetes bacterium]|nr:S8 family peptidase [Armatimonadota bacterium]
MNNVGMDKPSREDSRDGRKHGCSTWPRLIALALLSVTVPSVVLAGPGKTDVFVKSAMTSRATKGPVNVIAKIDGPLTTAQKHKLAAMGATVYRDLKVIGSVAVRVPAKKLSAFVALPWVKHVSSDERVVKNDEFTFEHSLANVVYSQYQYTGKNVTIAVVDSGISNHPDLFNSQANASRVLAGVSFVPNVTDPTDQAGHGTHVAGIIAGNAASSSGVGFIRTFYGIARNANLVNVRVLDSQGGGTVSGVVAGIDWVISHKDQYNVRILNLSLGHAVGENYTTDPLCQAVERAWSAGIFVVCSAGNAGRKNPQIQISTTDNEGYGTQYGSISSPGNDPYVITVGAMKKMAGSRDTDRVATYSSRGPTRLDFVLKPDIMAPGNKVVSLRTPGSYLEVQNPSCVLPLQQYCLSPMGTSKYFTLSGTSMATPVVSGAAALMLEADPTLTPDTLKARMMLSADKWAAPNGDPDVATYGSGYLNVSAALSSTYSAEQAAMSPKLTRDPMGNIIIDASGAWGERALWGTGVSDLRAVWGSTALSTSTVVAQNRALWGDSVWGDRALWGENFMTPPGGPIMRVGD